MLTKTPQSLSGTVPEHSLCPQCPHCLDLGLSLYDGHGLKLFDKHLGRDDAENMQGCVVEKVFVISLQEHVR